MNAFAHSEMANLFWIKQGIVPNTLTAGSTVDTYGASPQPAAGIDAWDGGVLLPRSLVVIVDVASVTGTGTLVVTLRDDDNALTTANGDANSNLAVTLTTITAAGLYYAEIPLTHVFPATSTRVTGDANLYEVRRYQSLRAVAAGCNFVFSALMLYGKNLRNFPAQDATALSLTWYDS